jgi:CHASE3 domain sensor protein
MIKKESKMDYNKLTKAELVEKLEELSLLPYAVEAKDEEISKSKKLHEEQIKRLTKKHEEEIQVLKKEKAELVTKYQGSLSKEQIEKVTQQLIEERNEAVTRASLYIKIHHDLLKQIQHTTEMALFSEQLVSEKFKIRGDK